MKFGRIVLQVHMDRLTESDFWHTGNVNFWELLAQEPDTVPVAGPSAFNG